MAEKFPMSKDEAIAYIQNNYGDKAGVQVWNDDTTITVNITRERELQEGEMPPHNARVVEMRHPAYYGVRRKYYIDDYIYINEFKKSVIDEKLKEK